MGMRLALTEAMCGHEYCGSCWGRESQSIREILRRESVRQLQPNQVSGAPQRRASQSVTPCSCRSQQGHRCFPPPIKHGSLLRPFHLACGEAFVPCRDGYNHTRHTTEPRPEGSSQLPHLPGLTGGLAAHHWQTVFYIQPTHIGSQFLSRRTRDICFPPGHDPTRLVVCSIQARV